MMEVVETARSMRLRRPLKKQRAAAETNEVVPVRDSLKAPQKRRVRKKIPGFRRYKPPGMGEEVDIWV